MNVTGYMSVYTTLKLDCRTFTRRCMCVCVCIVVMVSSVIFIFICCSLTIKFCISDFLHKNPPQSIGA